MAQYKNPFEALLAGLGGGLEGAATSRFAASQEEAATQKKQRGALETKTSADLLDDLMSRKVTTAEVARAAPFLMPGEYQKIPGMVQQAGEDETRTALLNAQSAAAKRTMLPGGGAVHPFQVPVPQRAQDTRSLLEIMNRPRRPKEFAGGSTPDFSTRAKRWIDTWKQTHGVGARLKGPSDQDILGMASMGEQDLKRKLTPEEFHTLRALATAPAGQ